MVLQLSPDDAGDKRFVRALRRKLRELEKPVQEVEPPPADTVLLQDLGGLSVPDTTRIPRARET